MTEKQYIPLIDYLKAFAICMVTTTHFFEYDDKGFPLFIYVIQMGMPLFMLLIGYNTAMSNERHELTSLRALYAPAHIRKKFNQILPSYTIMFVIEAIFCGALVQGLPLLEWIFAYISGGLQEGTHGGYFFCIYWQFLLIGPILYLLVKHYPRATMIGALLLDMLYEYSVGALDIPRQLNRLIFMRYLFIAVFGMYFYLWRDRIKLWLVAAAAVFSLGYITAMEFFDFEWPLNIYWKNTCVYASFYFIAIMVFAFHFWENKRLPEGLHRIAYTIGRSTWHIYLTQMLFFRLYWGKPLDFLPLWLQILCGVTTCVLIGVGWNKLERRFRKAYRAYKKEKNLQKA